MRRWRASERLIDRRRADDASAERYEQAVRIVVQGLRRFETMPELLAAGAAERAHTEALVEVACRYSSDGQLLVRSLVEGAAFWRRLRELIGAAVTAEGP